MTTLLQTEGLTLKFGGVVAADAIDFQLRAGERLAVIGANGAGKTTFINMVTGYIKPSAGQIRFDGTEALGAGLRRAYRTRGFAGPRMRHGTIRSLFEGR